MAGYFVAIADAPEVGGKARSLARLRAAGLPTPAGFVITDALFRALRAGGPALGDQLDLAALDAAARALVEAEFPPDFAAELERRVAALGGPVAVRSSFATEDDPEAVAAGIHESRVNVEPAGVANAVRAVLASALAAGAVAYLRGRGRPPAQPPVAVLIHAYVPGPGGVAALAPGAAPVFSTPAPAEVERALKVLSARHGSVEVEWAGADPVTFLQLRPYRAAPESPPWTGLDELPPEERGLWKWDAAHNPLPLSPAQAGLVELVDTRCRIGLRQRVLGGYLFYAPGGPPSPKSIAPEDVPAAFAALRADVEGRLARPLDLEEALALFVDAYEPLFGIIQPAARAARRDLQESLTDPGQLPSLLAGVESMASERRRRLGASVASYLELFGDEAPVWDVAAPTYREAPEALRVSPSRPPPAGPALPDVDPHLVAVARAAVAVGEDDDWLYARVQAAVRRALLAVAAGLGDVIRSYDDVFFLPLPLVRELAAGAPPPFDLDARVAAARAAHQAALATPPGGAAISGDVLRGSGTGGRVVGRVWRHRGGRGPADAVLVADTLLPTELPLISAAALVTEIGGPLDHVAAQARERGLPAVVGVGPAARGLADGTTVLVDADRGVVVRLR
jgi:phosphohistidine swiveling domain-containing protein